MVIDSASSSGISVSNSSSNAITNSTVSSESAPRSSTKDAEFWISSSLTPSCSATIFFIGNEHLLYPPSLSPSENLQKIHRVCCTKASKQTVYLVQKEQVSHFLWKVLWWLFVALSNGNLHNLAVLQRVTRVMSSFWWQTIYKSEDKVNFGFISIFGQCDCSELELRGTRCEWSIDLIENVEHAFVTSLFVVIQLGSIIRMSNYEKTNITYKKKNY